MKTSLVSILRKLEWVCLILLFLAGMAKLLSLSGQSQVLKSHDPIFGISNRSLFLYVGMLEIGLSAGLLIWRERGRSVSLPLAGVGMTFLAYKGALMHAGFTGYCACLGSLTESLGIDQGVANTCSFGGCIPHRCHGKSWHASGPPCLRFPACRFPACLRGSWASRPHCSASRRADRTRRPPPHLLRRRPPIIFLLSLPPWWEALS